MKKFLIILFASIIGIIKINAYDITDTFYYDTKVENMYITKVKGDISKNGAPFLLHRSNGDLVYCIEPFLYLDNGAYYGYNGYNELFNLSEDVINKMNLIAHYGYGYNNHTDLKWYGITQYLIWNELELDDLYFTDGYYGNRIVAYQDEINEINRLIDSHYVLPAFDDLNIEALKEIVLTDDNNVLNNFEIETDSSAIRVEGNKLILDKLQEGTYTVTFVKKDNQKNYMLYHNEKGQDLLLPGKIADVKKEIVINVKKGYVKVFKHDSVTDKARDNLSFKDALYGIYDLDDNLIKELSLDELGQDDTNLPFGKYYLMEITPPVGYLKDSDKHYFEINFDNNNISLDVYDDVISKRVIINKLFGNEESKIYSYESGVTFEVYDYNNNLVATYTTNQEGKIELDLIYGTYRFHQVNSLENYDKVDDFYIDVKDQETETITLYDNEKPIDVPDTYKDDIDYVGAISILLILFIFNLGVYAYRKNICKY